MSSVCSAATTEPTAGGRAAWQSRRWVWDFDRTEGPKRSNSADADAAQRQPQPFSRFAAQDAEGRFKQSRGLGGRLESFFISLGGLFPASNPPRHEADRGRFPRRHYIFIVSKLSGRLAFCLS